MKELFVFRDNACVANWSKWAKKCPAKLFSFKMFQSPRISTWHLSSMCKLLMDNVVDTERTGNTTWIKSNGQLYRSGEVNAPALQNVPVRKQQSQIVSIALLYLVDSPPHSFWLGHRARKIENLNIEITYYCCVTTEFKTSSISSSYL